MHCQQMVFFVQTSHEYRSFMELSTIGELKKKKIEIAPRSVGVVSPGRMPRGLKGPLWIGVGDRLRLIGVEAHLTQREIGEAAGMPSATISHVELDQRTPGIDTVERLATALGISASWLAFGDQGILPFRQRHPRPVLRPEPQNVSLAARPFPGHFEGLGERLKLARAAQSLSFQQLSKAVEERAVELHAVETQADARLTRQALHLLETGQRVPSVRTCWLLALGLDVSPGWLAYGEGEGIDDATSGRS